MNTTYKKLFLEFMNKKQELIKNATGIDYLYPEDIKWLKRRNWHFCKKFLTELHTDWGADNQICPWCIKFGRCLGCTYERNHGNCTEEDNDSTYAKIANQTDGNILSIPGMEDLVLEYKTKADKLQKQEG